MQSIKQATRLLSTLDPARGDDYSSTLSEGEVAEADRTVTLYGASTLAGLDGVQTELVDNEWIQEWLRRADAVWLG